MMTRTGSALLEAVVALAVLASIVGTAVWLASDALYASRRAHEHEDRVLDAQRLMSAVSLWPASDLDLRLGETVQGSWRLYIHREMEGLYEISIADSSGGPHVISTALMRNE